MSGDLVGALVCFVVAVAVAVVLLVDGARTRAARISALERSVQRLERRPATTARPEVVDDELVSPLTTCADCYFSGRPCPEHVDVLA